MESDTLPVTLIMILNKQTDLFSRVQCQHCRLSSMIQQQWWIEKPRGRDQCVYRLHLLCVLFSGLVDKRKWKLSLLSLSCFLSSFLPSFIPSFLPSFIPSFLPIPAFSSKLCLFIYWSIFLSFRFCVFLWRNQHLANREMKPIPFFFLYSLIFFPRPILFCV